MYNKDIEKKREVNTMARVKVNNVPEYAEEYRYLVVRDVEGKLWFWGAWNDENKARTVAREVGGLVVEND